MMHMTLYWGKEVTLLFDSWKTDSWPSYGLTLLFCFLLSLCYQHLEARRLNFNLKFTTTPPLAASGTTSINAPLISPLHKLGRTRWVRLALALLFGVNTAIGYLIMLAIMSYNGGVLVAVVLGLSVGYFLFRSGDFGDGDDSVIAVENNPPASGGNTICMYDEEQQ